MPRIRLVASLLIAVVLLLGAVPAAASENENFLALGDSIAFGYDPLVRDPSEPENFVGYPEALAGLLGVDVVNASCPGEASGSFLDKGADANARQIRLAVDGAGAGHGLLQDVMDTAEGEPIVEEVGEQFGDAAQRTVADQDQAEH